MQRLTVIRTWTFGTLAISVGTALPFSKPLSIACSVGCQFMMHKSLVKWFINPGCIPVCWRPSNANHYIYGSMTPGPPDTCGLVLTACWLPPGGAACQSEWTAVGPVTKIIYHTDVGFKS